MNANLADTLAKRAMRPNYGASQINHQWTDDTTGLTFSGVMHYDYQPEMEDGCDCSTVELRTFVLTHVSYGNTSRTLSGPIEMTPECCPGFDLCESAIFDIERGDL